MMPPKGKMQSLHPEVLSNLPENVIDEILMRLPLRDAVRTSIISKKWRYNWCRLPQLALDRALWEPVRDLRSFAIKFTDILYHLLTLHIGPISKLILDIPRVGNCPKIDNLISFLSRKDIQHFVLRLPSGTQYRLPSSFFACLQLRHLTLKSCLMCPPPVFMGFERLISLELSFVRMSSEFLGSLISHCPLLDHLLLKPYYFEPVLEINAPKLRSFVFIGFFHTIRLKNVPLLEKVSFMFLENSVKAGMHSLAKFFESTPALKNLVWEGCCFRYLTAGAGEVPRKLASALNCLKRLYLTHTCLDQLVDLSGILCLIRSSPYLEDFEIEVHQRCLLDYYPDLDKLLDPATREYVDEIPASFSDVTLNHLRVVKIKGVAGVRSEMQLIKILLAKSPTLVRMVIDPYPRAVADKQSLKVLAEITKYQRASTKAEVIYNIDAIG